MHPAARHPHRFGALLSIAGIGAALLALIPAVVGAASAPFIGPLRTLTTIASTVPANGDVNPYGVAVVPRSVGHLIQGDVLVSNFNDKANLQGTGTTIVQISPGGSVSTFITINAAALSPRCPGGVGLTTALVVLRSGWVIVGSLPTTNGMAATAKAGCLLVINSAGVVKEVISGGPINGPWDMTALDMGSSADLFVTNVLNGTVAGNGAVVNRGTVVRLDLANLGSSVPQVLSQTIIGSGFAERTDPVALVIGPTGVGLASNGTLYVADSLANRIAAIPNAVTRTTSAQAGRDVSTNGAISDPLGMAIAPNGDILTANGNNGKLVETTPAGAQVATRFLDTSGTPPGAGALFGIAIDDDADGVYFVDDANNTFNQLH
jgi:hypothetical protein